MSRFGRNIDIDLSTGKIEQENMSQKKVRQNLGGLGYNVETLYGRIEPGIDAFEPDNLLVISRGLLTGSVAHPHRASISMPFHQRDWTFRQRRFIR